MINNAKKDAEALREILVDDCVDFPRVVHTMLHKAADSIESLAAELEQVKRERDAVVEDLKKRSECNVCAHQHHRSAEDYLKSSCMNCVNFCNWQWRGVNESLEV
jgi:hypothetical protein